MPNSDWQQQGYSVDPRFALYMYKDADAENPKIEGWVNFTKIEDGLYCAYFNKKYANMIICRMRGDQTANEWVNKMNQSQDLSAPSVTTPVYRNDGWDHVDETPVSIESSGHTVHKIYVQDKDASGYTPYFYEYQDGTWYSVDTAWPGTELTTETVEDQTWYVFKTLKTSLVGRFMQAWHDDSNFEAGGHTFDLSGGNVQYNYYPTVKQSVKTSEALASIGTAYFRGNNGASTLKKYFWNHEGLNDDVFTTETVGGVEWLKIQTYKPTIGIQFYTYDNLGNNTDKCWGNENFPIEAGTNYYYARMYDNNDDTQGKAIHKYESTYYLVYGNDENLLGGYVEMTPDGDFGQKVTLDNLAGNNLYYGIFPASAYDTDAKSVTTWNSMLCPWYEGGTAHYEINNFENHDCAILPTTWKRWKLNGVKAKYDISFDFITMTWSSRPYIERNIDGYATFSSDYAVAIPDGVTAFYATAAETGKVTMTSISDGIPANTGAFLKADNDTYKFTPATSTESTVTPNLLVAGTNAGVAASTTDAFHYVFASQNDKLGFFNVVSDIDTNMTGKAYLETTKSIQPDGSARVAIVFDEDVTGINTVSRENVNNNEYYNLAGQRVAQPAKGLYIVNGKKVIMK